MELYDDSVAVARLLNRICIPPKQDPFFMELLWFRKQFYARDLRRISHQMHRHAFYEVHFPFAGEVTYELKDGGSFTLDKGQYLLLPPGAAHRSSTRSPGLGARRLTGAMALGSWM